MNHGGESWRMWLHDKESQMWAGALAERNRMQQKKIAKRLIRREGVVLRGPTSPWQRARLQLLSAPRSPLSDVTVLDGLDEDDDVNGDDKATICSSPTASEAETQLNGPSDSEETKTKTIMAPIALKEDHHDRVNNKMSIEAAEKWKARKQRRNKKDKERKKRRMSEAMQTLQKAMVAE